MPAANDIAKTIQSRFRNALRLANDGDLNASTELLEDLLATDPEHLPGLLLLGRISRELGNLPAALKQYEQIAEMLPENTEAVLGRAAVLTEMSNIDGAITVFESFLSTSGDDGDVLYQISLLLATAGRVDEADVYLQRGLPYCGDDAVFCTIYGAVALAREKFEDAVRFYQLAVGLGQDNQDVLSDLGVALQKLSRHEEAITSFQTALQRAPEFAPAHVNMAQSLTTIGKLHAAHESLLRAVELSPETPEYARSLGLSYSGLGRYAEGIPWFFKAVELRPAYAEGHNSLAIALSEVGRYQESLEAHKTALQLQPDVLASYQNLALAHIALGQFTDACTVSRQAVEMEPQSIKAKLSYSFVLEQCGQHADARAQVEAALALDARHFDALEMKCAFLKKDKLHQQHFDTRRQILEIDPDSVAANSEAVEAILNCCDWKRSDTFVENLITRIEKNIGNKMPIGVCVNNLQSLPLTYDFIAKAAAATATLEFDAVRATRETCEFDFSDRIRDAANGLRIRIGYLIPYVHFHSLPIILKEIVSRHDRSRFEVFGYCPRTMHDSEFARDYVSVFDKMTFGNNSDRAVAEQIYQDKIDILIDIAGLTIDHCMAVNALRPAPIIAHFLGYSITTGADYVDYLISDEIYVSADDAALGPEAMVYMPDCFLATRHFEISDNGFTRAQQGLPDDAVIFCNFNQPFKFERGIFSVWMRILNNVPDSVMWFGNWGADSQRNLKTLAKELNVDSDRLIFSNLIEHSDHLERLGLADLALDTFHHGGGVTTVDCLWAGVPVLSCAGTTPPSRLGKSVLYAAEMPELVMNDLDDYESTAISLGQDRTAMSELRQKWQDQRLRSPLFDNDRYMHNLETAYDLMWKNHISGAAPKDMWVQADA